MKYNELLNKLYENKDEKYKLFNDKIINTKLKTIGVKTPILKLIAKDIIKKDYNYFLNNVKNNYYEEVFLEGLVITSIKNYDEMIQRLNKYVSKIDNWAICDMVIANAKIINKNKDKTLDYIKNNIKSNNEWKKRVCFVMLLDYFIEEKYLSLIFDYIENDSSNFYYVYMAKAWLISICYIKYPDTTLEYLKRTKISNMLYNKAISKICDSKRVLKDDKITLKNMKKNRIIA